MSRQNLDVPEGGSNTYKVVLGHRPTGNVTVTVTVDDTTQQRRDNCAGDPGLHHPPTGNVPKTVTVRAAEDDDAITDDNVTISHSVSGANYEGVTTPRVDRLHHRERRSGG